MKLGFSVAVLTVVLVASSAYSRGGSPHQDKTSEAVSSSPSFGVHSHVFEGEGEDTYVNTDLFELSGQYEMEWEISDNVGEASGDSATFDASLKGEESVFIASQGIADGSGSETVRIDKPGKYYARVFAVVGAHWTLTLTRT